MTTQTIHNNSLPLIDWLYAEEINNINSKQGALIIFPRTINRWNISSSIVTNWEKYNVIIVTDYPNEFISTTEDSNLLPFEKWSELELVQFTLLKYSDLLDINRSLHNTEIDIILFDDARMLSMISTVLDFTNINPKIIVLSTWGDTMEQLGIVTEKLPGLRLLTFNIINDITDIQWLTISVKMSDRQLKFYKQGRELELEARPHSYITPYSITRRLTIYAYPDNIMNDQNIIYKPICESESNFNEKLQISLKLVNDLENDGAKLASILDGIVSHWPAKQIIISRFNHLFGTDLIKSFLEFQINSKLNPYDMSEVYYTSCTSHYDDNLNNLNKFSDSKSGVLITNIVPLISLKNIEIIHIADSYSFKTIKMVIDKCHKRYLNNIGIKIYSHVATTNGEEPSSDSSLHDIFTQHIVEANNIYSGLITSGDKIVYNPVDGLIVVTK